MTITQKILAAKAGKNRVRAGELIECPIDLVFGNDITAPVAIDEFYRMGAKKTFDSRKIALVCDHFTPNKDIAAATLAKKTRDFARAMSIDNFFDVGRVGVEHALLPELGLIRPGDVVIGADSHTCTHGALGAFATGVGSTDMAFGMATGFAWFKVPEAIKVTFSGKKRPNVSGKDIILHLIGILGVDGARYASLEFVGTIDELTMADRFTISNMAVEAGAKNGVFAVDAATRLYLRDHKRADCGGVGECEGGEGASAGGVGEGSVIEGSGASSGADEYNAEFCADEGAVYSREIKIDLGDVPLTVAYPSLPENARPIEFAERERISIDQALIGSCTNGRIEDMRAAAAILKGKSVAERVRLIIIPATQDVYAQCLREGLTDIFVKAGAAVSTPTCGPCLGGHMGVLAAGERCVATTNRNFVGRMGHTSSEVWLASPAVAAASAVAGFICGPDSLEAVQK